MLRITSRYPASRPRRSESGVCVTAGRYPRSGCGNHCLRRLGELGRQALEQRVQLRFVPRLPVLDQLAQAVGTRNDKFVAKRVAGGRDPVLVVMAAGARLGYDGLEAVGVDVVARPDRLQL